ncbi:MAG: hypothetical protein CMM47_01785 [Rhodospirillaceae bacterium]|nr:hypothetical protein [Rhodospirillaceae bacterium]
MTDVVHFPRPRGEESELADQLKMRQNQAVTDKTINLRWLFGVIRRHKVILIFCVMVIPVITTFIVFTLTPSYIAQSRLLIESMREQTASINHLQTNVPFDLLNVETEAEVIRSREFARHALDRLNLLDDPTFNPNLIPPVEKSTMAVWRARYVSPALAWMGGKVPFSLIDKLVWANATKPEPSLTKEELTEGAIDKLMRGTRVIPVPQARVIIIQQTSADAEFAARAANTFAEIYIDGEHTQKVKTAGHTSALLANKVDEMRDLMLRSQKKLEEFRTSTGVMETGDTTLLRQQILQSKQNLLKAETERAEVWFRYERARTLLANSEGIDNAANILNSQLINNMRVQAIQLQIKLTELRSRYRSRHPKVIRTRKKIADLKSAISDEIKNVVARLEIEAGASNSKVNKTSRLVADLEERFRHERETEASIRALAMEVNANKQLYDVLLERLKETNFRDARLEHSRARIISRAITPRAPVFPRTWIMIFTSGLIGLGLGVLIGVGLEFRIPGYRTLVELHKDTTLPVLSMIPAETEIYPQAGPVFRVVSEHPHVRLTESMRKLHDGLSITTHDHPSRLIAVTSTLHGEGKTSTVLGLAAVSIQTGHRVLVIDCDIQLPNIHLQLGVDNVLGMSDLLSGRAMFDDVIEFDLQSGIHYVTSGQSTNNSDDLVNSEVMDRLIDYASNQFDLVLFNTPPVLSEHGSLSVLPKMDQTVFCVKWERTPRRLVKRAMRSILETGARMYGTVLTHVDLNIQRMVYGHDYTYYYYYSSHSGRSS